MVTTLARTERLALADLLDEVGPDAPTLCGDWTTRDLAAHLVIRERRPDAAPGLAVKALSGWTAQVQESYAERPYAELVELVRTGPGRLSAFALPGVDKLLNTAEYVVHHEDVRRAAEGWTPRSLPDRVRDALWKVVIARAQVTLRGIDATVELRRSDRLRAHPSLHGNGAAAVRVTGAPMEVLLFLFGRREHAQVVIDGDQAGIAALEAHSLAV